jgi:Sulfatase
MTMTKGACSPACRRGLCRHARPRHLACLVAVLERVGVRDDTLILVLSDHGASQEGGPLDGEPVGSLTSQLAFNTLISWSGLDIGRDRGSPLSHYEQPFEFTGRLSHVTVVMCEDQTLGGEGIGQAVMARQ